MSFAFLLVINLYTLINQAETITSQNQSGINHLQLSTRQVKQNDDEDFEFLGRLADNEMIFDNLEHAKPKPKRRSIKFKCKSVVKKPTRRSTRHTLRKNYTEEEVPDDDHYICKFLDKVVKQTIITIIYLFKISILILLIKCKAVIKLMNFVMTKTVSTKTSF